MNEVAERAKREKLLVHYIQLGILSWSTMLVKALSWEVTEPRLLYYGSVYR